MEISMLRMWIMAALSLFCGILLGVVYDLVRFVRVVFGIDVSNPFKKGKRFAIFKYLFVAVGDLLFFVIAAVVMCVFFFLTGDGRVRGFALAGTALAFWCYYKTVGKLFIGISERLAKLCKKGILKLLSLIFYPFSKIFSLFWNLPIVRKTVSRYNIYIIKRKKKAEEKKRRRKMKKREYCKN